MLIHAVNQPCDFVDLPLRVSRYGLVESEAMHTADLNALRTRARGRVDVTLGDARARAALMITLALPGSVYLYQGEELGLPEVQDLPDDARRDPIWARSGGLEHGRNGCRVPLPWRPDGPALGFSPEGAAAPWLPQPAWFSGYAVAAQDADPISTLAWYRRTLAARRDHVDRAAPFMWLDAGRDDVLAFRRGDLISVTVYEGGPFEPPAEWGLPVHSSSCASTLPIQPNTTTWLRSD